MPVNVRYDDLVPYDSNIPYDSGAALSTTTPFDTWGAAALAELQAPLGILAFYTPYNSTTARQITVIPALTPPQMIIGEDSGQVSERWLQWIVSATDVLTPSRGDTYVIKTGPREGTWVHVRVEKASPVRWLITTRFRTHDILGGPGAVQVKP